MTSGGNFEGLPDIIKKLTESPEIADIIKNAGLQQKEEPKEEPRAETANEPFNLSPEMMAKLPSVISMLQGMGITGEQSRQSSEQKISESAPSVDMNELAAKLQEAELLLLEQHPAEPLKVPQMTMEFFSLSAPTQEFSFIQDINSR